jgi:hypothetical protein
VFFAVVKCVETIKMVVSFVRRELENRILVGRKLLVRRIRSRIGVVILIQAVGSLSNLNYILV